MQNLTVNGANTVARINGRANFADDMLDTTVMLLSGQTRYITDHQGPGLGTGAQHDPDVVSLIFGARHSSGALLR